MNFIGGLLLIFLEEEKAFWVLVSIIENILPKGYFEDDMVGSIVDIERVFLGMFLSGG